MTPRDFCYWLHGFFEISGVHGADALLSREQIRMITRHLDLVFTDAAAAETKATELTKEQHEEVSKVVRRMVDHGPTRIC